MVRSLVVGIIGAAALVWCLRRREERRLQESELWAAATDRGRRN